MQGSLLVVQNIFVEIIYVEIVISMNI